MRGIELNLKLYQKLGKQEFTVREAQREAKLTYGSAKVILNRLKKNVQALPAGHGRYVLIKPENWLALQRLRAGNQKLYHLAISLYLHFPKLSMLVLYGSQVTGHADRYSDFDVLAILPDASKETSAVKKNLEIKLGIKLHLTVYSEKAFDVLIMTEPYLKFWLNEGIIFDEKDVIKKAFKTNARVAYMENIETAKEYIKLAEREDKVVRKANYYLSALEMSLMTKEALHLSYNYENVRNSLIESLGGKVFQKIRQKREIQRKELDALAKTCKKQYKEVASYLKQIGENEADSYWRNSLRGVRA